MFYVLGHRAEYVTFAWMVWEVTHDALHLGYLGLAQGLPLARQYKQRVAAGGG